MKPLKNNVNAMDKMEDAISSCERALMDDMTGRHWFTSNSSRESLLLSFIKDRFPEYAERIDKVVGLEGQNEVIKK